MGISRPMKHIEELSALSKNDGEDKVAAGTFLDLVASNDCTLRMTSSRLNGAVTVQRYAWNLFYFKAFRDQRPHELPRCVVRLEVGGVEESVEGIAAGQGRELDKSGNVGVVAIVLELLKAPESEQEMNDEQQEGRGESKDRILSQMSEGLLDTTTEPERKEEVLEESRFIAISLSRLTGRSPRERKRCSKRAIPA